ncbi:MAG: transcriptional regulator [Geobacteraceae bacterium]|nr:transcriptional regulator [Geobacteraceae bacterium]
MFRLLFFFVIGYSLYRLVKGFLRKSPAEIPRRTGEVETFQDPVCGMFVTREDAVIGKLNGERIYFCSTECLEKYQDTIHTSTHAKESGGNR